MKRQLRFPLLVLVILLLVNFAKNAQAVPDFAALSGVYHCRETARAATTSPTTLTLDAESGYFVLDETGSHHFQYAGYGARLWEGRAQSVDYLLQLSAGQTIRVFVDLNRTGEVYVYGLQRARPYRCSR